MSTVHSRLQLHEASIDNLRMGPSNFDEVVGPASLWIPGRPDDWLTCSAGRCKASIRCAHRNEPARLRPRAVEAVEEREVIAAKPSPVPKIDLNEAE